MGEPDPKNRKIVDTVSPMKAKVELTFLPVRTTDGRGLPRPAPGWAGQGPLHFFIARKTFPWSRARALMFQLCFFNEILQVIKISALKINKTLKFYQRENINDF